MIAIRNVFRNVILVHVNTANYLCLGILQVRDCRFHKLGQMEFPAEIDYLFGMSKVYIAHDYVYLQLLRF